MHLIVCIDDKDGVSFCGRRLSQDKALNQHILQRIGSRKLWIAPYSQPLFPSDRVIPDPDFQLSAGREDVCFLEVSHFLPHYPELLSVTLYRWNRRYPSTVQFPRELLSGMRLTDTEDFPGNSHEMITMERYCL